MWGLNHDRNVETWKGHEMLDIPKAVTNRGRGTIESIGNIYETPNILKTVAGDRREALPPSQVGSRPYINMVL